MPEIYSKKGYQFGRLTHEAIGACISVARHLGQHLMEVDYQRALRIELGKRGIPCSREVQIPIIYDGTIITKRRVDFVIGEGAEEFLLETKARSVILSEDIEQCLLYLRQGGYRLCLLVNFGEKPLGIRRFVNTL